MKKYLNIIILFILGHLLSACSEKFLDKTPLDRYSDATVWTDINLPSLYLNSCYASIGHGFRSVMLGAVTDEMFVGRGSSSVPYLLGTINGDLVSGAYGNPWYVHISWAMFPTIQKINLFLDKIDQVPEAYTEPKKTEIKAKTDVLKGEALFLRAFIYTNLCRTYGGLPILDKANQLGDDFSLLIRSSFEETVNFIVKDCDDAAYLLKVKSEMESGRATKEAALALKSRILLFAASDLTADGTAKSELVGYKSGTNRTALWTAARDAAKAVIDLGTCKLSDFGAPDQNAVAKNYFKFFMAYNLLDDEIIFGKRFVKDVGTRHQMTRTMTPNGYHGQGRNGPLQRMVDEYEMSDGSKFFDHFSLINEEYKPKYVKFHHENPYYDREPRFYASVLYDSAVWAPRPTDLPVLALADPLGIYERRTHVKMQGGVEVSKVYGIDTRNGPIEGYDGCYGGYLTKKFMDVTTLDVVTTYDINVWIYIRYAEILFNYAEACLELGDLPTATTYINMIRNRAGLSDFTGDITEALRHERKVELYAEESRWYDIRRWRILEESLSPPSYGIDILEINNLDLSTRTTTWKRIVGQVGNKPSEKLYWIPIETSELKRAPQLIQNPGY